MDHNSLTVDQILDVDWYKNHPDTPQSVVKLAFKRAVTSPEITITRHGNSLLLVNNVHKDFHFINADGFNDFVHNVVVLLNNCKERVIHTDFTNPLIIEVAKHAGVNFEVSETDTGYLMTVRL